MTRHFCITGQSNYAVAIILDTLAALYPTDSILMDIIANIPAEQNDSLEYPFAYPGVTTRVFFHPDWHPGTHYEGYFAGSIGKSRKAIVVFFQKEFGLEPKLYPYLIHPSAVCSPTAKLGNGVHVSPLSVLAPYAVLGDFVVINRQVSIGHHTVLENFVTINPGVNIAGCCHIGENVTIGAGAAVLDKISIGKGSIIGAGSVVTRPIPEGVVAYGAPAKVIRSIH